MSDGGLIVADNVLKPGAPYFLWEMHYSPLWDFQIVSLREYASEDIEDWMSVSSFHGKCDPGARVSLPEPPRCLEKLAFETDVMRWRAMTEQLNVSDWVRNSHHVRQTLGEHGIYTTASVVA